MGGHLQSFHREGNERVDLLVLGKVLVITPQGN